MDILRAVTLARRGDERGFRWLFDHYRQPLYRYLRRNAAVSADTADEVLQATFIRAFNGLAGLQNDASWEPWLLRIARRETLRLLARQPREQATVDELDIACERQESHERAEEKERLLSVIRRSCAEIEPEAVRVTAQRYYLGERCTTEQLAAELGVPHATVRKRLFLFRNKLRARLLEELRGA